MTQKKGLRKWILLGKVPLVLLPVLLISCTGGKIPEEFSGKLMVRLAYRDYIITASSGNLQMHAVEPIQAVYTQSQGVIKFKRNSISDNQKRTVWLQDQQIYLFDALKNESRLLLNLASETVIFGPVISPDGNYVAVTHSEQSTNTKGWSGNYVINIVDAETGKVSTVLYENKLRGPNLIVPGMARWLNDSSGFTYHRTKSFNSGLSGEICFYDVKSGISSVIAKGIGGALSPKKDKLLWISSKGRNELRLTDLKSQHTYKKLVEHLIDYAWSPDGSNVAILQERLSRSRIIISDDKLEDHFVLVDKGPQLQSWDIYITPIRWIL